MFTTCFIVNDILYYPIYIYALPHESVNNYQTALRTVHKFFRHVCNDYMFIFQEFVDYFGGAGAQHIALNTDDIIQAVNILHYIYTTDSTNRLISKH